MKHLSSIVLAAVVLAAGAVACFKDPTSSVRNGPTRILLTRSSVDLRTGDSLQVQAEVKDEQGNTFDATDAVWASSDATIAAVHVDTSTSIPFNAVSRAFVVGVGAAGGVATVSVTSQGVTNQMTVVVLPVRLTASVAVAVTGTAHWDTIAGTPNYVFSAGDTVVFTVASGGLLTFDAAASVVGLGTTRAYIVSRTTTVIKAIARNSYRGRPWVTKLTFNGPAAVGTIAIDSLQSDSIQVSKPRFYGSVTQTADTMYLNAPAGATFKTAAPASGVRFGSGAAIVLASSASQLKVISPVNYTGVVTVTSLIVGSATLDSVKTAAGYTIAQAAFGGTVVTAGKLLDTVKVIGTAVTKLDTGSVVTIGGVAAWVVKKYPTTGSTTTLDSMYVIAKLPSTGPVSISRVNVGGNIIPSLATAGNVVITETPTGDPDIPAIYAPDAVVLPVNWATVTAANPYVRYGAVDDANNYDNFFAFTLTAARTVHIQVQFTGTGAAGTAANPDIDLMVCNAGCGAWVSTAGASSAQPENITLTSQAAGSYNILVEGWSTGGTYRPYKLIVY